MKVLHISTTDSGGAGGCCIRIHQSLLEAGVESKVLVLKKTRDVEKVYDYGRYKDLLCKVPSMFLYKLGLDWMDYSKIKRLQEGNKAYTRPISNVDITTHKLIEWADIIHLHWINDFVDYPSFFKKIDKPIVWTLHDENLFYGIAHLHKDILPLHPLEIKYKKIKHDAVKSAKNLTIVFLSQMMNQTFGDENIIEGRFRTVINNSVNSHDYCPCEKFAMRQKYGFGKNLKLFAFISMNINDPNKGLQILSDALMAIYPDARILAIGNNSESMQWKNVISIGFVSGTKHICEILSCADYLAMPSYQEAFSQSPLQAMACGLPVVAFPVSGTSELINDQNGVICDDFTQESLQKGITKMMGKEYDRDYIRQDVINRFSPKVIATQYILVYQKAMRVI